ncbi:MAG: tetratricopeptide repeat protein [Chitinophagales bacterium]|nr:tetratricopeptide repeat protein [Chitinophagales bacterium]
MKHLRTISVLFAVLCAVALSLKGLREPDLWWQIKTGEWILENGKVPTQDVFSYTQKGEPWINIKWGFEVVAAFVSQHFGAENVFLIQVVMLLLLLFFLYKLSLELAAQFKAKAFLLESFLLLLPLLFISIDYRINGRPEMSSHLLSVVFLWLNLKYRNGSKNAIWWIIPLQCLWANVHEAFAIGIVINLVFLVAAFVEQKLILKQFEIKKYVLHFVAVLLSIAAIFFNPYGAKMLLQPFDIFNQVFENKYTTELLPFTSHLYWQKEAWLGLALLTVVLAFVSFLMVKSKKQFVEYSLAYWLLILAFIYLAQSAFRNIVFLDLILFPIVVCGLSLVVGKFKNSARFLLPISAVALLFFYVLVITNVYYKTVESRDSFGLQVRPDYNPIGAAAFIQQQNLQGKCFSDYLTSSYLLWKIKGFETFIDLRDLDVFPASFFDTFTEAVLVPEKFQELDKKYNFNYAVLFRPQYGNLHIWLANGNGFRLKYVDAIAAVYVKSEDTSSLQDVFQPMSFASTSKLALGINHFVNPFYHVQEDFSVESNLAAASYYLNIAQPALALKYADKLSRSNEAWKGLSVMGEIYYQKSFDTGKDSSEIFIQTAQQYFTQSLKLKENYVPALMGAGTILFKQGFYANAKTIFEKASSNAPDNVNAWVSLAECYKATLQLPEALENAIICFEKANSLNPNNPNILLNLGVLYYRKNNCVKSVELLKKVQHLPTLSSEEKEVIETCLKNCGAL